jgi:acetate kinase
MNTLVLNCGSSSVKFQIIETDRAMIESDSDRHLAKGVLERIGSESLITCEVEGAPKYKTAVPLRDHRAAIDWILRWIVSAESKIDQISALSDIHVIGHRVVHGGERFQKSVAISEEVLEEIEDCIELAPLHNPANLSGIRAAQALLGKGVPQVAVFDTSFHSTMPEASFLYGIPYQLYRRHKIRRYGFHGTSHRYIAYRYRMMKKLKRDQVNIISLHLGNGASACAIKGGRSFNTTMGFTPLEGLLMGTRAGDIDPSIIEFLHHKEGMSLNHIDTVLNKQSGLLGISGLTGDMRELLDEEAENQDRRAKLAIEIFCRRAQRYVGGYLAEMGGADALVFTGGIGENSATIRKRICEPLAKIGIVLDKLKNSRVAGKAAKISSRRSKVAIYAIPTDEELLIARDAVRVIKDLPRIW